MTDNEPQHPEVDDLGLTSKDWDYLQYSRNYCTIEPAPGTVGAEALGQMDEYTRREVEREAGQ